MCTRRIFAGFVLAAAFLFVGGAALGGHEEELEKANASVEAVRELVKEDPYRPVYHVTAAGRFINDPDGPIYYKGLYHLFFQHLPFYQTGKDTGPGWGHAVSKDLVHWERWPIALMPEPDTYDGAAVASGACVINDGVPTIVYTSVPPQAQSLAMSTDNMRTWTKYEGNPVIASKPPVENLEEGFRDPFVWKEGKWWYMVVGSGIKNVGGTVLLYRSEDLIEWEFLNPMCTDFGEYCHQWECPNFFALGDRHVLIVSPLYKNLPSIRSDVMYAVGTYRDHKFRPDEWRLMDFGGISNFYAPNSMVGPKGRRIMWGWVWVAGSEGYPWNGVLTLPRVLTLREDGVLGMEPAEELAALRKGKHWRFEDVAVKADRPYVLEGVEGNCVEIVAVIEPGDASAMGLDVLCSADFAEKTRIRYGATEKVLEFGGRKGKFELLDGEKVLMLHAFLDKAVLELYANKRECVTLQVKPDIKNLGMRLFCEGGSATVKSIDVWEMDTIWQEP